MAKIPKISQFWVTVVSIVIALLGATIASLDNKFAELFGVIMIFLGVGLFWIFW